WARRGHRFSGSCMGKAGCQRRYNRCLGWGRKVDARLARLRRARLLAGEDPQNPGHLDTHPLVREYFGEQLRSQRIEAWKQCNKRLYDYYRTIAPQLPNNFREIEPLFLAVN